MLRPLSAILVLLVTLPSARADEVEIVRGGRQMVPKVIEIAPEESSQEDTASKPATEPERASKPSSEEKDRKKAEEARATQQRIIEELARQTQGEWRRAGNALAGE
ncbi:MAG: hypothetical protein M3Y59_18820 [Myxococcota bacterium]|nr:hypothetical protein [Myxococcota bacterium]